MGDTKEYIKGDKHVHQAGSVMIKFAQYNVSEHQGDWKRKEEQEAENLEKDFDDFEEVKKDDDVVPENTKSPQYDAVLIEKLKPIFYNNEKDVKLFLKEISGMKPSDITDFVNKWVKDKRISDYGYSRKGTLWKILNEAGLYTKSKQNWCRRVY